MDMMQRRNFLQTLGIGIPATLAARTEPEKAWFPEAHTVTPQEVFTLYVSEALNKLPEHWAKDEFSNIRRMIEAQGAALALVLAHLQEANRK